MESKPSALYWKSKMSGNIKTIKVIDSRSGYEKFKLKVVMFMDKNKNKLDGYVSGCLIVCENGMVFQDTNDHNYNVSIKDILL